MEWNDQMIDEALRAQATSANDSYPSSLQVWEAIQHKRKRRRRIHAAVRWTVAAATLTMITLFAINEEQPHQQNDALEYIGRVCKSNNIVCSSAAFKELRSALDASSAELATIKHQLQLFGDDEQLLRAKSRVEAHQAKIVKAIVQLL